MKAMAKTRKLHSPSACLPGMLLFACAVQGSLGQGSPGQGGGQAPSQAATPLLQTNPLVAMREFETPLDKPYELGRGDEISIRVSGRPELDGHYIVGPDGRVTLPLSGPVELAGKTREAAADAVQKAMSTYYSQVSVTVGVDKYTSNQVLLLGAVEHPGVQNFDRPPTLLEVISRGGAITAPLRTGETGMPGELGVPDRVAIYRGSEKVLWVELKKLLESGSSMADLRLQRDDIVYVPSPSERYVSVLGEVQHPGALPLESSSTLSKLLAQSGGLTEAAGKYPNIQIIQPSTKKTQVISFRQVLQPGALDVMLHPGDIIYVPRSGLARTGYALQQISPLVTLFTGAALFEGR
jgi:polysaccharide biosynthesis/export protein